MQPGAHVEASSKGALPEGEWPDSVAGLRNQRVEIAMMRTRDGHSRAEISRSLAPAVIAGNRSAPVNALGYPRVMFTGNDIDDRLARLGKRGARLVGKVVRYEDACRLCDIRAPEGIFIGLAGELRRSIVRSGTKADLKPGDLIEPGYGSNYSEKKAAFVYLTATLDAATWGAELAVGEGRGRIYTVEPTGLIEDDPNLTDKKFPGNPTKSYRTRDALRVTGEVADWQGHSAEDLKAMRDHLDQLKQLGIEAIEG